MLVADRKSTTSCFMSTGPAWHETMDRLAVKRWPSLREIRTLGAGESLDTLKELWPDIVDALFKAHSSLDSRK
jgi:hypothetical protein